MAASSFFITELNFALYFIELVDFANCQFKTLNLPLK